MKGGCSAIVPVYNAEKYLHRCVESIIAQSYISWECILVDDGSTDSSGIICDEFQKKDSRIKVIHQKNSGVSVARNSGLNAASGLWIIFVDADDWLESNALEKAVFIATSYNAQIVQWNYNYVGENIKQTDELFEGELYIKSDTIVPLWFGMVWSRMYSKVMLDHYSIRFPEGVTIGEDVLFSYEALAVASRIWCVKDRLINYFQNSTSASFNVTEDRLIKNVEAVDKLILFLSENNLTNKMESIVLQLKIQIKDNFIFWLKPMNCNLYRVIYREVEDFMLKSGLKRRFAYKLLSWKWDYCARFIVHLMRLVNNILNRLSCFK